MDCTKHNGVFLLAWVYKVGGMKPKVMYGLHEVQRWVVFLIGVGWVRLRVDQWKTAQDTTSDRQRTCETMTGMLMSCK